ncbi:unnamed protein product [Effrenium voratum]|nr:unnamed protein product [Effrenium voratum]
MEVKVLSKTGVTDDAVLSIRAGTVRRQAQISSGRPFRFPKITLEENPVKIDILQQVGTAYLVTKPGEDQYKVSFEGEFNAELEVQLSQMDGSEPKAEVEDRKQEAVASAKDAKEYLENHQVLQFVQAVLQTVIKERPSDPFEYMARHFMNGYSAQEAIKLCAKKEMTAAQPAPADPLPEPAAAEKKTEEAAPAEAAKETPAVEPQAAAEEPAAVAEMPAPEPAAAEEKIKEAAPMEAAKEMPAAEPQAAAEVPAAVAETPAPEPPAVEEKTEEVAPAEAAKEMPVVEPQASAEDLLRQQAAATLLQAEADGTLEAVLSKKFGQEPAAVAETPAPEPAAAEEKTEEAAPVEAAKVTPAAEPQATAEDPPLLLRRQHLSLQQLRRRPRRQHQQRQHQQKQQRRCRPQNHKRQLMIPPLLLRHAGRGATSDS